MIFFICYYCLIANTVALSFLSIVRGPIHFSSPKQLQSTLKASMAPLGQSMVAIKLNGSSSLLNDARS